MGITNFSETFVTPLIRRWKIVLFFGVALIVVGLLLLFNVVNAAFTLALLVSLALMLEGFDELAQAERHEIRWPSYALGVIWIGTGVVAAAWPGVTLWALAVVAGVGFIIGGLAQIAFAGRYRRLLPGWALWLVAGGLSVVGGIACLAWPGVTILALGILLGLRIVMRGVVTTVFAIGLRRLAQMTSPRLPT
ncbi:hypothetical protein BH20ACT4_BH20ACT4_10430 [soil metagenome]